MTVQTMTMSERLEMLIHSQEKIKAGKLVLEDVATEAVEADEVGKIDEEV